MTSEETMILVFFCGLFLGIAIRQPEIRSLRKSCKWYRGEMVRYMMHWHIAKKFLAESGDMREAGKS